MSETVMIVGAGSRTAASLIPMLIEETDVNLHLVSSRPFAELVNRTTSSTIDIHDKVALRNTVMEHLPSTIINLAAATNVDQCETDRDTCWKTNVTVVENLSRLCRIHESRLIHISTDYVFDGAKGPYAETDVPQPINYYGKSKLAGENVALSAGIPAAVVRTNVIYGPDSDHPDFVRWILDSAEANTPVKVVDDQFSNPTYVDDLAEAIMRIYEGKKTGVYHAAGADWLSRYDFARKISEIFKTDAALIEPVSTSLLKQAARRPMRAGLQTLKAQSHLNMTFRGVSEGLVSLRHSMITRKRTTS